MQCNAVHSEVDCCVCLCVFSCVCVSRQQPALSSQEVAILSENMQLCLKHANAAHGTERSGVH